MARKKKNTKIKLNTLSQINLKNKSALLRIDINSPVIKGKVQDNPRFEAAAKTLSFLLKKKAKVAILAHQGRPGSEDFTTLERHSRLLSKYTKSKIKFIPDLFGKKAISAISKLKPSQAIILDNVRAYPQEINPDPLEYKILCAQFDLYINDAFSVSHRLQASIMHPPRFLPSAIGLQFQSELKALKRVTISKSKKTVISLGGAKVEDYFSIFKLLKNKKNKILTSGVLGNLFLIASGENLGYESQWLKKNNYLRLMPRIKSLYKRYKNQIVLPVDLGLNPKRDKRQNTLIAKAPFKYKILDVGPRTLELYKKETLKANTVLVKGPLGFSEIPAFSKSTVGFLKHLSKLRKSYTIIGGGHSITTLKKHRIPNTFDHISLSGGALIKYISGEKLPGIGAIKNSK